MRALTIFRPFVIKGALRIILLVFGLICWIRAYYLYMDERDDS